MTSKIQMGKTYRHYKTNGLYVPLQMVRLLDPAQPDGHQVLVRTVTFTGDGPLENAQMDLVLSLATNLLFLRHKGGVGDIQVLYWSESAKNYFARPLSEFVEVVAGGPRFELVK